MRGFDCRAGHQDLDHPGPGKTSKEDEMNYPKHVCHGRRDGLPVTDEMGTPVLPEMVTDGQCHRSWCERCDPAPSALCPWCNGRGYSTAPIPPRQARGLAR